MSETMNMLCFLSGCFWKFSEFEILMNVSIIGLLPSDTSNKLSIAVANLEIKSL